MRPSIFHAISLVSLLAVLFGSETASAASREKLAKRLTSAQEYLEELMADESTAIPKDLIKKCTGIIILRQYKAGLGFGVKGGAGIALVKDEKTGAWSAPAFVKNAEGSFGFQIGGQAIDSVFMIMNKNGMEMLNKSKFKVGVDASAAAGPHGRDAEAKVSVETSILVYSKAKGLYAGASFEGGFLIPDDAANEEFYGPKNSSLNEILFGAKVEMPEEAKPLIDVLKKYSQ